MQTEWKNHYTEHGKLPAIKQFQAVVMRKDSVDKELFKMHWDKILPKAVGANLFNEEKKSYGTPRTVLIICNLASSPRLVFVHFEQKLVQIVLSSLIFTQ